MATQVAKDEDGYLLVISSGRVATRYDGSIENDFARLGEYFVDGVRDIETYGIRLEAWARNLPPIKVLDPVPVNDGWAALAFIHLGPRFPLPGAPYRPSYVHGHLPFHGTCGGAEQYYRYEQFPTSRRIDMKKHAVVANDTYGAPASEEPFTPTGLSAVGRFALPLVLPACWRYELTPPSGTRIYYGASVPLYGQSGGAVEVMFPNPFSNAGQIKTKILPIL